MQLARKAAILTVAQILMLLAGCNTTGHASHPRAITSTPPIKAIELTVPATVSEEGATTTFPVGKYKPVYEDDHGFYFEAPGKVLVDDIATYAFDGGVYVERGRTEPTHWYIIRPNGRRSSGKFRTIPTYKVIQ